MTEKDKLAKALILSTLLTESLEDLQETTFYVRRLKQMSNNMRKELDKFSNKVFDNCVDSKGASNYVFETCKIVDKHINENL